MAVRPTTCTTNCAVKSRHGATEVCRNKLTHTAQTLGHLILQAGMPPQGGSGSPEPRVKRGTGLSDHAQQRAM